MTHSPHIGGSALRALVARAGRPAFMPPGVDAAEKSQGRIWELADTLHCSIVGTCLTNAEGRSLLRSASLASYVHAVLPGAPPAAAAARLIGRPCSPAASPTLDPMSRESVISGCEAVSTMTKVAGVLLDLSGVVFDGDGVIGEATESIRDLRANGVPVRFVTNTTSKPLRALRETLNKLGIDASDEDIFTPATAARGLVRQQGLSPHLLVHPDLIEDFDPSTGRPTDAVIVGDAGPAFSFEALNTAFRLIDDGAAFIALARNRTFRTGDGELSLDAGPFVAALEYATRREALLLGKPSASFYATALAHLGTSAEETVMVGDDVESDVAGAMEAGMAGLLVRTGKYRAGDESLIAPAPTATVADLRRAVDWILERR